MFYTYVIESERSGRLYIGSTGNLEDRLKRHNENRSKATKGRGPWKLVWARPFVTRSQAARLERRLKQYKSRNYVLNWIESNIEEEDLSI